MKYTKLERNWVMYDVGNSALVLLNTSVVPIYFNAINTGASSADLVVAWGNAQTIASLVIAMLMPILGALADYAGNKIKFFLGFFLTGLVLCLAQAIPMSAMAFLTVYVLCTIGLNSSMTFYDAMLPDITTDVQLGLCLGLYRFHRAVRHLPGAHHGWPRSWRPYHAGNASVVYHHWCLVAHLYPAAHSHL